MIKLTQKLQLHPSILTALWLGLVATYNGTPYPNAHTEVLPTLKLPLQNQARLGWEQLYYGRISKMWAQAIDQEHPRHHQTGEQVLILILKLIWQFVLDTWKIRNQHLHQTAIQQDLPNYRQVAISLYEQQRQLPQAAQDALYRYPLETILDLPAAQLEQWVVRGHKYFNQQVRAAKHQAKLKTTDIRTFFFPQNKNDDLQPP